MMRNWINLCESQKMISLEDERGSVEGYVTDDQSIISNWFNRHKIYEPAIIEMVCNEYEIVAFLDNINVSAEDRGKGRGNELMNSFESVAADHGAEAIILLADTSEDQIEGFDLVAWYLKNGFEEMPIHRGQLYPLMLLDLR